MKICKVILYSFIAPLSIGILFIIFWRAINGYTIHLDDLALIGFISLPLWIIGIVVSIIFSIFSRNHQKKQLLFIAGQVSLIVAVTVLTIVVRMRKREPNSVHNYYFVEQCPGFANMEFKALRKLESTFKTPDDFRLRAFYSDQKDTLIGKDSSIIYYFYFRYELNDTRNYFTKVRALQNSVDIVILNGDIKDIPNDVKRLPEESKIFLDSTIQKLPDSERDELRKTLESFEK